MKLLIALYLRKLLPTHNEHLITSHSCVALSCTCWYNSVLQLITSEVGH